MGRQELEIILGDQHISYTCTKLGSVLQVQQSKDPEGLRIFYYLVQVRPAGRGCRLDRPCVKVHGWAKVWVPPLLAARWRLIELLTLTLALPCS